MPGKQPRRAFMTVDLDCRTCRGTGWVTYSEQHGPVIYGPGNLTVQKKRVCECLAPFLKSN